ncbi:MAG: DsbC family protein [Polaromonas sp.]|uniref:DsbC family protein n=1 Tax=Polaromonas sp. TaxID=1869339 RepID=UPI0027327F81|nr:DsbC family protein [Polaromonas sp.]MDP3796643.1 DsbC family protein [Polaromonas sp.]
MKFLKTIAVMGLIAFSLDAALAQEATIRKNLAERLPVFSKIDEVSKTPMNGLYELRVNETEIFYTDAEGNFLLQGNLFDTRAKRNLTEERVEKLTAIDFGALPFKDAFTVVRGNGKRKMAVFEDPNCGYCKRFERDLQKISDVTVYMFLFPILGPDSVEKSRSIWCAKDKAKAWTDLMVRDQPVPKASCDTTVLERNLEFGKKRKITGTPTLFFVDGSRVPGAISAQQVEKLLTEAR